MTDIRIKRLSLENFKCHKSLTLDFTGRSASVYGDNATGKTSIYDGLTWLLFGKDSNGNGDKNIEIKPLSPSGEVLDHEALTAVEAVLEVNGEEVSLRRTYREVWTTKRGSSEATYDGNTSEYYIDGVPCKKNAFQERVNELVSEDTFRLLTSVSHFASGISWQERRAVLFKVAGVMEDREILSTNEAFSPLAQSLGRMSLEDYKKKLLSEKKQFTGTRTEIPARISECQKTIDDIQGLDFAGAQAEAERLQARADGISGKLLSLEHDSAAEQKRLEIKEAQLELTALENENRAYRAEQSTGGVNIPSLNIRVTALQSQLTGKKRSLEAESGYIAQLDGKISASRSEWIRVNGENFTAGSCPTCGQALPQQQLEAARERFAQEKQKRLDTILANANDAKNAKAMAESRFDSLQAEVMQLEAEMAGIRQQITEAAENKAEIRDMEDYTERRTAIKGKIDALTGELADLMRSRYDAKEKLRRELAEVHEQIRENLATVSKEGLLDYSRERIESLREDARTAAQALEAIEKMLYLMDEYSRYKTRFVEDSVNSMFRIARFRLFREQTNGGVEDRCDVVYEGVPYMNLNNGMKINVGIDIINTLSAAYGVRVPLFVDNAESVTKLETCNSQTVRLEVSKNDKELRVNYG